MTNNKWLTFGNAHDDQLVLNVAHIQSIQDYRDGGKHLGVQITMVSGASHRIVGEQRVTVQDLLRKMGINLPEWSER